MGVASSTQGAINLGGGAKSIAPTVRETWTTTVQFDPASFRLAILSRSPATIQPSNHHRHADRRGSDQPAIRVTESDSPNNDLVQTFSATLNDGPDGRLSTQTLQLTDIGAGPLVVVQNGIHPLGGTNFHLVSVVLRPAGTAPPGNALTIAAAGGARLGPRNTDLRPDQRRLTFGHFADHQQSSTVNVAAHRSQPRSCPVSHPGDPRLGLGRLLHHLERHLRTRHRHLFGLLRPTRNATRPPVWSPSPRHCRKPRASQ